MRELLPPAQLQGSSDGIKVDVKKTPDLGAANSRPHSPHVWLSL